MLRNEIIILRLKLNRLNKAIENRNDAFEKLSMEEKLTFGADNFCATTHAMEMAVKCLEGAINEFKTVENDLKLAIKSDDPIVSVLGVLKTRLSNTEKLQVIETIAKESIFPPGE